ncbi:MAG TPA: MogA/MoaB family molybdenum cofactor biosynthesis protein [Anaerolineales bacterium]|nr:MogA/MoaB family molybdenum cofactor biosynthesis protein [Anaerolineales bacterium]
MIRSIRTAILTVSDRSFRGEREDRSGPALRELVESEGWKLVSAEVLPDERAMLETYFRRICASGGTDLILTTGGTGVAHRDVTPEATLAVIDRSVPGLAEAIRSEGMKLTPHAMLSRGAAGILGRTMIVNLAGSPKAVREQFAVIAPALPHAIQLLRDDPDSEAGHTT